MSPNDETQTREQDLRQQMNRIEVILRQWAHATVERKMVFVGTDGVPRLYMKARTRFHCLHVEGMISSGEFRFYAKLTKSGRNKHAHRDEIIGWDNLYHDRPHIHYNEDERREYRTEAISWAEIETTIRELEAK